MVRNQRGGNKGKKGARRHYNQSDKSNKIRLRRESGEIYAKIIDMHGNGADILCEDGKIRFLVWRQKFKGKHKRDNNIKMNGVVLAGLREWEVIMPKKKQKADLIFVYSKDHIVELYKKKDIPRQIFPDEHYIPMDKSISTNVQVDKIENEAGVDQKIMDNISLQILMDEI